MIIRFSIGCILIIFTIKYDVFFKRQASLHWRECLLVKWRSRTLFQTWLLEAGVVFLLIPAFFNWAEKLGCLVGLLRLIHGRVVWWGTCLEAANLGNLFRKNLNFSFQQLNICVWDLLVAKGSASGFSCGSSLVLFWLTVQQGMLFRGFETKALNKTCTDVWLELVF